VLVLLRTDDEFSGEGKTTRKRNLTSSRWLPCCVGRYGVRSGGASFWHRVVPLALGTVCVPRLSSVCTTDADFPHRQLTLVNPGRVDSGTDITLGSSWASPGDISGSPRGVLDILGAANC
jgi:hypothetical protein